MHLTPEETDWLFKVVANGIIGAAITSVISGFLMALLVWWIQRRIEKRDALKEILLPVLGEMETVEGEQIEVRYKASVPLVRTACAKYSSYILLRCRRRAFNAAWREYCGIKDDALEPRWDIVNPAEDLVKLLAPPSRERGRRKIVELLNSLIKLVC